MRQVLVAVVVGGTLALAGCAGDDMDAIAADACDDMVAAVEADDEGAFMQAITDATERAEDISDDPMEAQLELMEAFEDSCPELEELMLEDMGG